MKSRHMSESKAVWGDGGRFPKNSLSTLQRLKNIEWVRKENTVTS